MRRIDADRLRTLLVGCLPGWVSRGTIEAAFPEAHAPTTPPPAPNPVPTDEELRREFAMASHWESFTQETLNGLRAVAALATERARPRIAISRLQKAIVQGWGCNMVADMLREAGVIVED